MGKFLCEEDYKANTGNIDLWGHKIKILFPEAEEELRCVRGDY